MYIVPRFYSVWGSFISCLFRSLRSKKNISSEAFSPALHCTALHYTILCQLRWCVANSDIYSQDMHHTFLYVSLLKSLHYDNLRFLNFTVYGGREPQDNDFHFSFTEPESTPLESNRRKMRWNIWETERHEIIAMKFEKEHEYSFRWTFLRVTLRRFWFHYCFYYHFAKKRKIYILNFKKKMRQGSPRKPLRLVYRTTF